ncbi:MAG TPA: hypothetical protein VG937_02555 [Polyangiaceae bacterium]|nr:hypothetical protein [Polyangiaceae bacterium]
MVSVVVCFPLPAMAQQAAAQAPPEAPPPPPALSLDPARVAEPRVDAPPPPPPPRRRDASESSAGTKPSADERRETQLPAGTPQPGFVHDGFYLRVGLGGGYGKTSVQTDRVSQPDVSLHGFGAAFDAWFGWTLAPGLVLGPALSVSSQRASSVAVGEQKSSGVATHALLGAFLDAFPNPHQGQHFGGMLALASLSETTADGASATDYQGGGLGLSVFAGYDAWIAREWSLGAMLRLGGVATRGSQSIDGQSVDKQGTAYGMSLLVTVVYH